MPVDLDMAQAMAIWRNALCESVRGDKPDLTARQMAVLLTVYRDQAPATVRGLADNLNLQKPAVTRALDRLSILGLVRRKIDDADRRNVLVQRTVAGSVYLSELAELIVQAARQADTSAATPLPVEEATVPVSDGDTDDADFGAADELGPRSAFAGPADGAGKPRQGSPAFPARHCDRARDEYEFDLSRLRHAVGHAGAESTGADDRESGAQDEDDYEG